MNKRTLVGLLVIASLALIASAGLTGLAARAEAGASAAAATASPAPAPGAKSTPKAQEGAAFPELSIGSRDAEDEGNVDRLQRSLIALGYLPGPADGVYGSETADAIAAYQRANGLEPTGIATHALQLMLFAVSKVTPTPVPTPTPTPSPSPRAMGARGDDIEAAQEKLAEWGFLEGSVDGIYGSGTEAAVKAYKTYIYGLESAADAPSDATNEIWEDVAFAAAEGALSGGDESPDHGSAADESEPYLPDGEIDDAMLAALLDGGFQVYREDLVNGSRGAEVERLQIRLAHLGYLYISASGADGVFGNLTENALKYFQRLSGIEESGIADEHTQRQLYTTGAKESEETVFPYKLIVDISDQSVYVKEWTGSGYGSVVKTMKCSTGTKSDPTPLGVYSCAGRAGEWYYFQEFDCWAQYAFRIYGGYLFHSIPSSSKDARTINKSSLRKLGSPASHGCVRLSAEDAQWIYTNCPNGITVVIRE